MDARFRTVSICSTQSLALEKEYSLFAVPYRGRVVARLIAHCSDALKLRAENPTRLYVRHT